jgi:hypothetical protein
MMSTLQQGIPSGKTRVIGFDLFSHEDYIVKDCDGRDEAFKIADDHNRKRTGSMDNVYYVYDDTGKHLRGEGAVVEETGYIGVSP